MFFLQCDKKKFLSLTQFQKLKLMNRDNFAFGCGEYHYVGMTRDRKVYVWGSNNHGQLGLGDKGFRDKPQLLLPPQGESQWKNFVFGSNHTFGMTESGNVYAWGSNKSGQLGLGDSENRLVPQLLRLPTCISLLSGDSDKIQLYWEDIVCGDNYTIAITSEKKAYVCGSNKMGELGLGDSIERKTFELLPPPGDSPWRNFLCGEYHTIGITEDKKVYIWGGNQFGELGLNCSTYMFEPCELPCPSETSSWDKFWVGRNHTIGMTLDEKVYVWGKNKHGQLGLGKAKEFHNKPVFFESPNISPWKTFCCGKDYVVGATANGKLYFWGTFLEQKNYDPQTVLSFTQDYTWWSIVCGTSYMIGITYSDGVYIWGNNLPSLRDKTYHWSEDVTTIKSNGLFPSPLEPPTTESEWIKFHRSPRYTLLDMLRNEKHTDAIITLQDFSKSVHSALIAARCSILLEHVLDISEKELVLLLDMIYGKKVVETNILVLLDLYKFIVLHKLNEFEMEVLQRIVLEMNNENFFTIVQFGDKFELERILDVSFAHMAQFSRILSENALDQNLHDMNISRKVCNRLVRIHSNSKKGPNFITPNATPTKSLTEILGDMFQTGQGSDFIITIYGEKIPTHRFVLEYRSEYFQNLFKYDTMESTTHTVDLSDTSLSASSLRKWLEYLYTDIPPHLTVLESFEILMAQEYFSIDKNSDLITRCMDTFEADLTIENCLGMLKAAHKWNQDEVVDQSLIFIMENYKEFSQHYKITPEWNQKYAELFLQLL